MRAVLFALLLLAGLAGPAAAQPLTLCPGEALRGHFVQERFLSGFERPVRSEGSFLLLPGTGLIWHGETPFPVVTAITANGMVQSVGGKETLRIPVAKAPFLAHLYEMMSGVVVGDWTALEGDFETVRDDRRIVLTPRRTDLSLPLPVIAVEVGQLVERVEMTKPNGDRDLLRFSRQTVGSSALSADEAGIFQAASR